MEDIYASSFPLPGSGIIGDYESQKMEDYKERVSGHSRADVHMRLQWFVTACTRPMQAQASTTPKWRGELNMNPTPGSC